MEEVVRTVLENAKSLLKDARLLAVAGSFARAEALAILCVEECGKASLVHWKLSGWFPEDESITERLRGHFEKQRIINSYRAVSAIYKLRHEISAPRDGRVEVNFRDAKFTEALGKELQTQLTRNILLVESGLTDQIKQQGFYVDINEQLEGVPPIPADATTYKEFDNLASEHIKLVEMPDELQKLACMVYRADIWMKISPKTRRERMDALRKAWQEQLRCQGT